MKTYTLVTGASEGIGKEFARIAAKKGRNVILTARSEDKLNSLADELRHETDDVVVVPADLSTPDGADTMFAEASKDRAIDMFINNAGLGYACDFADPDAWAREERMVAVNMLSATRLLKLVVPHMIDHGEKSRIVNVASVAAFLPGPGMSVYYASKAYVLSLSEALSQELKNRNVTVTALCPGATQTSFFDEADMDHVSFAESNLASPREVAQAGWDGAVTGTPVVVPGAMNKMFAALPRFLPRSVIAGLSAKTLSRP
ncbi:MAG: SDR family oxidoreductase [Pseudomonadota bacterium]